MATQTDHADVAESQNAEEPEQDPQGEEEITKLSQQEEDQERFQLLVGEFFDSYEPDTVLEEAAVIRMASALWSSRNHREFNSDMRRLGQEISAALALLSKSKAIRKAQERRSLATGIMRNIHRKNLQWGLIRRPAGAQTRACRRSPREALQFWAPLTGGRGFGSGLNPTEPEEEKEFPRDRFNALYCKMVERKLTPDEQFEFEALAARDPIWHPKRIEDHPFYEAVQAWGRARSIMDEEAAARSQRSTRKVES